MRPPNMRSEMAQVRVKTKLTQSEFAAAIGVSVSTVESIESGRMKLSDRVRLKMATALDRPAVREVIEERVRCYRRKLEEEFKIEPRPHLARSVTVEKWIKKMVDAMTPRERRIYELIKQMDQERRGKRRTETGMNSKTK